MRKIYIFLLMMGVTGTLKAQNNNTIISDRPGQAITPFTVGKDIFQTQMGMQFREVDYPMASQSDQSAEMVFRAGLLKDFEVGVALNFLFTKYESPNTESDNYGVNTAYLKARYTLHRGKGAVPTVGADLALGIPVVNDDFKQEYIYPRITLMTNQVFFDKLSFTTNFGANWLGNGRNPDGFAILNFGYPITSKLGVFVESYANFNSNDTEIRLDGGFSYLYDKNLQFDLYGGNYKQNSPAINADFFFSAGLSWRIKVDD